VKSALTATFLAALLVPATLAAQPSPPPNRGGPGLGSGGPPRADASFFRGLALMALDEKTTMLVDEGKAEAAIQELRKVYDYDLPRNNPVYEVKVRLIGKLARLCATTGKKAEAAKTIKDMLVDVAAGTPAEAAAWFEAGKTYKEAGMSDEALKAFDRSIELANALAKRGPMPGGVPPGRGPREHRNLPPGPPPGGPQ
jgi:tetratricopeptide (TPR) repeat protein